MMPNTVVLQPWNSRDADRDSNRVRLGKGITAMRMRRRMTRKSLASRLRVTANCVGQWERGVSRPVVEMLPELLRVLETTFEELLAAGEPKASTHLWRHEGLEISEGDEP
jgi:transcriptional regulator with XRE-family HTH domain